MPNSNYTPKAIISLVDDIVELLDFYYETGDGLKSVERFSDAVINVISELGYYPYSFPMYQDLGDKHIRQYNMASHKVSIIYYVDDENLEVVSIKALHQLSDDKVYNHIIRQRLKTHDKTKEMGKDVSLDISEIIEEIVKQYSSV